MPQDMPKRKEPNKKLPPARTPEARENQLIRLATDLAEKKLRDGSASSQLITEFVKRGSTEDRIRRDILERQKDLITAKTEALKSQKRVEELYANALTAMKTYSGSDTDKEDED